MRFSKHKRHRFNTIFLTGSKLPSSRLTLFFSKLKVKGSYRLNHNCLPWLLEMVILGCYNTVRTELLEDLVLYVFSGFINKSSVLCIGLSLYNNFHSFFRNSLLSFLSVCVCVCVCFIPCYWFFAIVKHFKPKILHGIRAIDPWLQLHLQNLLNLLRFYHPLLTQLHLHLHYCYSPACQT